jgi:hypothetical protein
LLNHNQTTAEDKEKAEANSLDDLPVDDEEQVKGGTGGSSCPPRSCGLNHNETTAEDNEKDETRHSKIWKSRKTRKTN